VEALFRAYFMEGIDLNDHDALVSLAASVGFDWVRSRCTWKRHGCGDGQAAGAGSPGAGIDIVPFFIFNGKVTVSGAHDVPVLLEAMARATATDAASVVE